MATVTEKAGSRRGSYEDGRTAIERTFTVEGADDEMAAIKAVREVAGGGSTGAKLKSISVEMVRDETNEFNNVLETYTATVRWEETEPKAPEDPGGGGGGFNRTVKFTTRGTTRNERNALSLVDSSLNTAFNNISIPRSLTRQINARFDGPAEGVDIIAPNLEVTIERQFGPGELSPSITRTLYDCTGSVNSEAFLGAAAGELLFAGADGTLNPDGSGDLTFSMLFEPNVPSRATPWGDTIKKDGWDYFWTLNQKVESAGQVVMEPVAAYVSRVYPRRSFSSLPIL